VRWAQIPVGTASCPAEECTDADIARCPVSGMPRSSKLRMVDMVVYSLSSVSRL